MDCSGLEGRYLNVCNIVSERYQGEYRAVKGGRAPDKGDAVWLVNQGITDDTGIQRFLGISVLPIPITSPKVDDILKYIIIGTIILIFLRS